MQREYVVLEGPKKGPTSVVMAGVHGNESCGIRAIEKMIPLLKVTKGRVIFLLGNVDAIAEKKRFIDQNLNRMFRFDHEYPVMVKRSYEYCRAAFIMSVLDQADAMLDLHSTLNKSEPFIICGNDTKTSKIVDTFPKQFTRIVYGIDEFHPGSTDWYMHKHKKVGICVECGQHDDSNALKVAKGAIYRFLHNMGHIDLMKKKVKKVARQEIHLDSMYKTKTDSFKLARVFDDFTWLKKGELIGMDGAKEVRAKDSCIILFAVNRNKKGEEGFLIGYKIKH